MVTNCLFQGKKQHKQPFSEPHASMYTPAPFTFTAFLVFYELHPRPHSLQLPVSIYPSHSEVHHLVSDLITSCGSTNALPSAEHYHFHWLATPIVLTYIVHPYFQVQLLVFYCFTLKTYILCNSKMLVPICCGTYQKS